MPCHCLLGSACLGVLCTCPPHPAPALPSCPTVVEQMARHMRSRGLPLTLGTASALLTAQALQHGHDTAKWLLQLPGSGGGRPGGGGSGGSGSGSEVRLPNAVVDSCLLGRGDPRMCAERLTGLHSSPSRAAGWLPDTAALNVVLAGLAVHGCTEEAFRLFAYMKGMQQEGEQRVAAAEAAAATAAGKAATEGEAAAAGTAARRRRAVPWPGAPDQWTYSLLLFAALNAPKEQQLDLTLKAVQAAR